MFIHLKLADVAEHLSQCYK